MERKVKMYDIEFGQVVFSRIDGKVIGMKLHQVSSIMEKGASCTTSLAHFICADGIKRTFKMFEPIDLFHTIEDCIANKNSIKIKYYDFTHALVEDFGFNHEYHQTGMKMLGATKYYWDGYNAIPRFVRHYCFDLYIENDGIMVATNHLYEQHSSKYKLYDSYEECKQVNAVQVITF